MAASFYVNTLQVKFESVLAMEHTGMARLFKSLVDTGLEGFLAVSDSVYEAAVVEFFANAKVIAGESVKLHPQKVLTNKSVHTYIKKNQEVEPTGEFNQQTGDTASGTEGGQSKMTKPVEMQVVTQGEKKKKRAASEKKKVETTLPVKKKKTEQMKKVVEKLSVEARSQVAPTKSKSETSSDDV
ncbi:hypothetical protein F511_19779 [Dorcoceras hygrometricum]|uniref:Uncharacterized protein n=1 Tax=Dorcoceras hygrometricum TaxID=472368 RepID=A0A2Z7BK83_9LAMI|nr:hypothetical protein F511_19779 [Dorcoceras hygrometricum]